MRRVQITVSRMKHFGFDEIAVDAYRAVALPRRVDLRCGVFPFEFGRQPRPAPIGEGIGLEITDVRDRLIWIDRAKSGQSKVPPGAIAFGPVERSLPALFVYVVQPSDNQNSDRA